MTKPYYVTSPIYYVNDVPHIGHAYTSLACDVMARYKRLCGDEAYFLTGTDEHGQKVEKSAEQRGVTSQEYADSISEKFRDLTPLMGLSNDGFVRTTEERHKQACQELWKRLQERDQIYLGSYKGWYSTRDEAYYAESELIAGEGKEKLAPTGAPVEWVEEPSYFFKLSEWQEPLLKYYDEYPDFIAPESRRNEVMSFVKGGLLDLSVSRTSFSWGVPVPGDDKHIMYVWLDALTNYLTATGFPEVETSDAKSMWPADLHVVGKDILRFHAVYWPAFLLAAELPLPKRIIAHGWWTNEGQKISKSLGNVIDPHALVEQYGVDPVRYFLMREVPFGNDGDFSHEKMIARINADLANNIGNLAQRTLSMIVKNCDGKMPEGRSVSESGNINDDLLWVRDVDLMSSAYYIVDTNEDYPDYVHAMNNQRFHEALMHVFAIASTANEYIDEQAPWTLKKTDTKRMGEVLYTLAETVRGLAILLLPFVPQAAHALLDQLEVPEDARSLAHLTRDHALKTGTAIEKPEPIFPRYVEAEKAA